MPRSRCATPSATAPRADRAFIDDVTEVYNARYLLEALDREIRRAERYGTELSILFLDLDRFKLVNDTHGHLVGSNALRQLSRLLEGCVRQVDTLARYGGDEFTILLVDTGERVARAIAERIRQSVERHAFEAGPGRTLRLSCSLGISTYPAHGRTREALLDTSDKAMYRAKSQGRNRVVQRQRVGLAPADLLTAARFRSAFRESLERGLWGPEGAASERYGDAGRAGPRRAREPQAHARLRRGRRGRGRPRGRAWRAGCTARATTAA